MKRSGTAETEYPTVELLQGKEKLSVCNVYSPADKALLNNISPNQDKWITVGDYNSHSPSWGYGDLDSKGEEVEQWMAENQLVLINQPDDEPTFFSRAWTSTSSPDLAIATENIHKNTVRELCPQLGGSHHKPVILTIRQTRKARRRVTIGVKFVLKRPMA